MAKAGGGPPVRATSLTNVVALGARFGDALVVSASGPQAAEALAALRALADEGFGDGIAAAPRPRRRRRRPPRPRRRPPRFHAPACGRRPLGRRGVRRRRHRARAPPRGAHRPAARAESRPSERERERLDEAIGAAREAVARDREAVAARAGDADAAIFDAHLALLDDEALLDPAHAAIAGGDTAEGAWHDAAEQVAALYRGLDDPLLRERAADVLDVGRRVVAAVTGERRPHPTSRGSCSPAS